MYDQIGHSSVQKKNNRKQRTFIWKTDYCLCVLKSISRLLLFTARKRAYYKSHRKYGEKCMGCKRKKNAMYLFANKSSDRIAYVVWIKCEKRLNFECWCQRNSWHHIKQITLQSVCVCVCVLVIVPCVVCMIFFSLPSLGNFSSGQFWIIGGVKGSSYVTISTHKCALCCLDHNIYC